jgi:5-methylcytosine-specific restriction endonuclease McrA
MTTRSEYRKRYYYADLEKSRAEAREKFRRIYASNPEIFRARKRAWYQAHKEKARSQVLRRKARLRDAISPGVTPEQWTEILESFGRACAYCLRTDVPLERDHVEPLSRGGLDEPSNVVPACKSCNSRKCNRTLLDLISRAA